MNDADTELDVKGLNCPMPLLKAKKALNRYESRHDTKGFGDRPGSERDFEVFARQSGNTLLDSTNRTESIAIIFEEKLNFLKLISIGSTATYQTNRFWRFCFSSG